MMSFKILQCTALGDAALFGLEYAPADFVKSVLPLKGYVTNPRQGWSGVAGNYSDDTQRALANAEVIVSGKTLTQLAFANSYVHAYHRDPRAGYARGYRGVLESVVSGTELLEVLSLATSDKSGGAMGAVVCGIYPKIPQVIAVATMQGIITHNTTSGINSSRAAALMGHYFLYKLGPKAELAKFLEQHVKGDDCNWSRPYEGPVGEKGSDAVRAAVTAIMRNDSLFSVIMDCAAFTGDVDTAGAIAGGAASACEEIKDDLPCWMPSCLENGKFGWNYLVHMDSRLEQRMAELNSKALEAAVEKKRR
jgi:ADP-ribosylglycohydrolase